MRKAWRENPNQDLENLDSSNTSKRVLIDPLKPEPDEVQPEQSYEPDPSQESVSKTQFLKAEVECTQILSKIDEFNDIFCKTKDHFEELQKLIRPHIAWVMTRQILQIRSNTGKFLLRYGKFALAFIQISTQNDYLPNDHIKDCLFREFTKLNTICQGKEMFIKERDKFTQKYSLIKLQAQREQNKPALKFKRAQIQQTTELPNEEQEMPSKKKTAQGKKKEEGTNKGRSKSQNKSKPKNQQKIEKNTKSKSKPRHQKQVRELQKLNIRGKTMEQIGSKYVYLIQQNRRLHIEELNKVRRSARLNSKRKLENASKKKINHEEQSEESEKGQEKLNQLTESFLRENQDRYYLGRIQLGTIASPLNEEQRKIQQYFSQIFEESHRTQPQKTKKPKSKKSRASQYQSTLREQLDDNEANENMTPSYEDHEPIQMVENPVQMVEKEKQKVGKKKQKAAKKKAYDEQLSLEQHIQMKIEELWMKYWRRSVVLDPDINGQGMTALVEVDGTLSQLLGTKFAITHLRRINTCTIQDHEQLRKDVRKAFKLIRPSKRLARLASMPKIQIWLQGFRQLELEEQQKQKQERERQEQEQQKQQEGEGEGQNGEQSELREQEQQGHEQQNGQQGQEQQEHGKQENEQHENRLQENKQKGNGQWQQQQ